MSAAGIESVLFHAMSDAAFADQLFKDTEKALAGVDLTAEEIALLKSMSRAEFDDLLKSNPEERKSFGINLRGGWDGNHNENMLAISSSDWASKGYPSAR